MIRHPKKSISKALSLFYASEDEDDQQPSPPPPPPPREPSLQHDHPTNERPHLNIPPVSAKVPYRLSGPEDEQVHEIPATINQYLRDYQREGAMFLYERYKKNCGGILGDDMGLGKTIQVIAFLAAIFGKKGIPENVHERKTAIRRASLRGEEMPNLVRVLIVCPGSVLYNWQRELDTWGYFEIGIFHGVGKEEILKKAANGFVEVVLTSFDTARSKQAQIDAIPWSVLIVDEVHKLKEPKTKVTQVLKALKVRRRFGLTGTAIQNKYSELWCILDWANPGSAGSKAEWNGAVSRPLKHGQRFDATNRELAVARQTAIVLRENFLSKWMLRRTKGLISQQLPKKEDKVIFCPLTATQRSVYERILGTEDAQLISRKNENCDCGSDRSRSLCCYKKNSKGVSYKDLILQYITILQKISNHLALIMPDPKDDKTKRQKDETLSQIAFPDSWKQKQANFFMYSDPENCGKWKILQKLLKNWERQESKVLLFSYSVRLLNMLEKLMISEGYAYCRLDGTTPVHQRMDVVDKFNTSPSKFVFLISTRAGGVGLNVTSANIVVVFDPNWNPSHDLQAQDRAFRIGQRRDVKVYRLIAAGSLEELVYGRQIYKQQQMNVGYTGSNERRYFTGVEGDANRKGELFGVENIFAIHGTDIITKLIVERTEQAELAYQIADLHVDEAEAREDKDDNGEEAMNEEDEYEMSVKAIAEEIMNPPKFGEEEELKRQSRLERDTVAAILEDCGVSYTHVNENIIGSSEIEERIGKKALKAVESDVRMHMPAFRNDLSEGENGEDSEETVDDAEADEWRNNTEDEDEEDDEFSIGKRKRKRKLAAGAKSGQAGKRKLPLIGNTPVHVRQHQLAEMAQYLGFESTKKFADRVLEVGRREQKAFLNKYYKFKGVI